jgi:23S rRNA (uracil1939-C5)-methyltransferase
MNGSETNRGEPAEAELAIEKLIYGGQGLARLEGRVVLAPFVLPGERVRVRLEEEKPGRIEASLVEVLEPAAGRTDPPCPYFYRCGGCQYQHMTYEAQLEQKRAILREAIERIGKIQPPEIAAVPSEPWGYRNRTQLHLDGSRIGYFGFGTHRLIDIGRCPISSPKINETIAALRAMMRDSRFPRFLRSIELFTNETHVQLNVLAAEQPPARRFFDWCAGRIPGFTPDAIDYEAGQFTYRVRHRSFFQVNRFLLEEMVRRALEGSQGNTALDLYSGVGLFSLPLARRFAEVTAVETSASAVGDLEFNARQAGLSVNVRRQRAEEYLASLERTPDFVFADPPRAGLGRHAVRELLRLGPPLITIVSCDPATLARDLAHLAGGGYTMEQLTLMDLFPQTSHIEAIARLKKTG